MMELYAAQFANGAILASAKDVIQEYEWRRVGLGFSLSADHFGIPLATFDNARAAGMDMRSYARLLTSRSLKRVAEGR